MKGCLWIGVMVFILLSALAISADDLSDNKLLFEIQVNRLVHLGYPQALKMTEAEFRTAINPLSEQLNNRLRKSDTSNIPFLIVFPRDFLNLGTQFDLLEAEKGKRGSQSFREDTRFITDDVEVADKPYLIFDVDTGIASTSSFESLEELKEFFAKNERRGLLIAEVIAMATHFPEVLHEDNDKYSTNILYAIESTWWFRDDEKAIPVLLSTFGYPTLFYNIKEQIRCNRGLDCKLERVQIKFNTRTQTASCQK